MYTLSSFCVKRTCGKQEKENERLTSEKKKKSQWTDGGRETIAQVYKKYEKKNTCTTQILIRSSSSMKSNVITVIN